VSTPEQVSEQLRTVLAPALGFEAEQVTVDNLRPFRRTGNRISWAFDAVSPVGRLALILQAGELNATRASPQLQARAQLAAGAKGAPVARVIAADDSTGALGSPFVITEVVKGEADHAAIVRQLDSADPQSGRARLLRQCARALAAIHMVDLKSEEGVRADRLDVCRRALDTPGYACAPFEFAYRWLAAHQPMPAAVVLVHGDYRMGNLLVEGTDLTAVLDWEAMRGGEAYQDLAWFCLRRWRFGAPASLAAGGLGPIEDFLSAYEDAGGATVDREVFHWWRVLTTLFWAITCCEQLQMWLRDKSPAMQVAMTGRAVTEAEWDLLRLLDGRVQ
jgi:aminoglycoside phosphotransferase (APT) family kinase protein